MAGHATLALKTSKGSCPSSEGRVEPSHPWFHKAHLVFLLAVPNLMNTGDKIN